MNDLDQIKAKLDDLTETLQRESGVAIPSFKMVASTPPPPMTREQATKEGLELLEKANALLNKAETLFDYADRKS